MPRKLTELLTDSKPVPLDWPTQSDYVALFEDLQANVITGNGFDHCRYYLLSFSDEPGKMLALRHLLATLSRSAFERAAIDAGLKDGATREHLSRASKQQLDQLDHSGFLSRLQAASELSALRIVSERDVYDRRDAEREATRTKRSFSEVLKERSQHLASAAGFAVNVAISATGYRQLGGSLPEDPAFRAGMYERRAKLKDRPEGFERWYQNHATDALVTVSYRLDASNAQPALRGLEELLRACVACVHVEDGQILRFMPPEEASPSPRRAYAIEPFGYRDAISQPVFYEAHRAHLQAQSSQAIANAKPFDSTASLGLALVPDPGGRTSYSCGTYFVLRKLRQHIAQFYEQTEVLAASAGITGSKLRERMIGRKLDGTPLTGGEPGDNEFDFSSDEAGAQCPFSAHARKVNPRGDVRDLYDARAHRIVRRATAFGPVLERIANGEPKLPLPEGTDVGLLFLCAQANIAKQFEHLQANWANPYNHLRGKPTSVDPIMGQLSPGQTKLVRYDPADTEKTAPFGSVVELKGGEYYFAPSISFLKNLLTLT